MNGLNAGPSVLLRVCLHQLSDYYIICLHQFRGMILTILFALVAIAALLQEEDVPFGQTESEGPDERV